jgi:hypothetical protein
MPPRINPRPDRLNAANRTLAILRSDDPLHHTCDNARCENIVDLSAPGLRGLYARRTAPNSQVEVLCPQCDDNGDKAGKSSSSWVAGTVGGRHEGTSRRMRESRRRKGSEDDADDN